MVIDTSAIVSILFGEAGAELLAEAIDRADFAEISAASVLEIGIVVESRFGDSGRDRVDRWLRTSGIEVTTVTLDQVEAARAGFRRFGKGRHPAGLNFGDCFAYGLAKMRGDTLLFMGRDFARTDVRPALPVA